MGMTHKEIGDTSRNNGDANREIAMNGMTSSPSRLESKESNTTPSGEMTNTDARSRSMAVKMTSMEGSNKVLGEDEDKLDPNRRIMPGTFPIS